MKIYGYTNHTKVLNKLKVVSISVVCSRWEEPFATELASRQLAEAAVIISNRGGLPETTKDAIILKELSSEQLFFEIEKLIKDEKII